MKHLLLLLLCAALLLGTLCSCAKEQYDLLYEFEKGGLTYCVRGSGTRARQVVVKRNSEILFHQKTDVDRGVGTLGGDYGLSVLDLNFDGADDFMLANEVAGDCIAYTCWLWSAEKETFVKHEALTGLCNIQTQYEPKEAIMAFSHSYEKLDENPKSQASVSTDAATQYVWEDGELLPHIRVSMSYYSETNAYLYSVAYYDVETGTLVEDYNREKVLSAEEYRELDLSFLYYFK